jgi:hypothetical protein
MRRRVPDNSLAGRLVRFKPTTTVDTIILKVAKSMLSTASGEVPAGASR